MSDQTPRYSGDGAYPYPRNLNDDDLWSADNHDADVPYYTHLPYPIYQEGYHFGTQTGSSVLPEDHPPTDFRRNSNTSTNDNTSEEDGHPSGRGPPQDGDLRHANTESFVGARQRSFERHEEFRDDPAAASRRRIAEAQESARKCEGKSRKKGDQGGGGSCKPPDKKHHRRQGGGGGGNSGSSGKGSSSKESIGKESRSKEAKGKESNGKKSRSKESSSKTR